MLSFINPSHITNPFCLYLKSFLSLFYLFHRFSIYIANQFMSFADSCLMEFMEFYSWNVFNCHDNFVNSRIFFHLWSFYKKAGFKS